MKTVQKTSSKTIQAPFASSDPQAMQDELIQRIEARKVDSAGVTAFLAKFPQTTRLRGIKRNLSVDISRGMVGGITFDATGFYSQSGTAAHPQDVEGFLTGHKHTNKVNPEENNPDFDGLSTPVDHRDEIEGQQPNGDWLNCLNEEVNDETPASNQ